MPKDGDTVHEDRRPPLTSEIASIETKPIQYFIRIGVIGHRKLHDAAAVQALVKTAIEAEMPRLFSPESRATIDRVRAGGVTPISYSVLTALAEGADRVVARAILECPGARLNVVLPLAIEDYLDDFTTEESKQEFRELLALCRRPVLLRSRNNRDERHDPAHRAELRRYAYKAAGEYVVDYCDVLVAVWNGEPARGEGGTAEIVQYALGQARPVIRIWKDGCVLLNPEAANNLDHSELLEVDRFNRQPIAETEQMEYSRNLARDLFERGKSAEAIPAETRLMVDRCLLPYYARASIVAKRSRDAFYRAGRNIYVLSAVSVACAALGVLFPLISGAAFGAELALLLVIFFTLRQARRQHAHQSWIEYRFLTERIRSGVFMAICGVEPTPIEVLPHMGHSQSVNDWTVRVFNEIWNRLPALTCCGTGSLALSRYVCEKWISEQLAFHRDKVRREGRMRRLLARASTVVIPVTAAAAALHLLLLSWVPGESAARAVVLMHEVLHRTLAFIALLFPAIAASLAGMEAHREHLRLEKRSANMVPHLERLNRQMASVTDAARFEDLLRQLDELMLREAQDWLMLMRYVEIKAG